MSENTSRAGQDNAWQAAWRAWVLVKVKQGYKKAQVSESIMDSNRALIPGNGRSSRFIIRADVVSGEYDIVVPLCGQDQESLDKMIADVIAIDGVDQGSYLVATVESHNPKPPQKARGYITEDEKNPHEVGITGSNAWG
jgi:DNA-binding Lrp family transcriptional regulator